MANEIQTVRILNFTSAPAFSYFAVSWPSLSVGGNNASSFDSSTPTQQLEDEFETSLQVALDGTIPGGLCSITHAMDGDDLVFTVEFSGALADTNIDQAFAADWGEIAEPVIATVQDGGEDTPAGIGHINLLTMGCG